jgi:hypothetical protein
MKGAKQSAMRRMGQYNRYSRQTGSGKVADQAWFSTMFGLHLLTLGVVLWVTLASCGIAGATPPPTGYVWTNSTDLAYLTWNPNNGQLAGTSTSVSYANTMFADSTTPGVFTVGYRGTQDGTSVQVTLHALFDVALSGTLSDDGQRLTLNVPDAASGQLTPETWVAVTAPQEAALLAAFHANEVVGGMLPIVQQNAAAEPTPWTDQNSGSLAQLQSEVQDDQAMLTTIRQARAETTQCQDVQRFQFSNLLTSASFVFSYAIGDDALMTHLSTLEDAWKQVEQQGVPQIAGLAAARLSWVVSPVQYQAGTRTAMQIAALITQSKRADTRQLQALAQQYQRIMQTEQAIAKSCLGTSSTAQATQGQEGTRS